MVSSAAERCGIAAYSQDLAAALRLSAEVDYAGYPPVHDDAAWFKLSKELSRSADVVHIQYHPHFCGYWRTPSQVWRFRDFLNSFSKPVVVTVHDLLDERPFRPCSSGFKGFVYRYFLTPFLDATPAGNFVRGGFLKPAHRLIVHWSGPAEMLEALGVEPRRIFTLYPGVPAMEGRESDLPSHVSEWLKSRRTLGMIGFVRPNKGFETVFQALARLPGDIGLLAIGGIPKGDEAYFNHLRSLIESQGLSGRVMFTNFLPNAEAQASLKACRLILLPYAPSMDTASYGLSYALSSGVPVLTSDAPYFRELEKKYSAFRTFEKNKTDQLVLMIQELLKGNPEMACHAEAFRREWGWPQVASKTLQIYKEVLQKREVTA